MKPRVLPLLLLTACGDCRHSADETGSSTITGTLDFGAVPTGTAATLAVAIDSSAALELSGTGSLQTQWLAAADGTMTLLVTCDPAIAAGSGSIEATGATGTIDWTCTLGDRPPELPAPYLNEVALDGADSLPENGLGDAAITPNDGARFFADSLMGNLFLTDPVAGRVWRQGPFYVIPSWGVWVTQRLDEETSWIPDPDCFPEGNPKHQGGECTGAERQGDGTIPADWSYYHGGFLGNHEGMLGEVASNTTLQGVRDGAAIPESQVLLLVGAADGTGWAMTVDAGLIETLPDEDSYSYLNLYRTVTGTVPDDIEIVAGETTAWGVDPTDGALYQFTDLDTTAPAVSAAGQSLPAPIDVTAKSNRALVAYGASVMSVLTEANGAQTVAPAAAWGSLGTTTPTLLATDGTLLWAWFAEAQVLGWETLDGTDGGLIATGNLVVTQLRADSIEGGAAAPSTIAYLTVEGAAGPELRVAQALTNRLETTGIALPGAPIALGGDPLPHDLYIAYAAGTDGCDAGFATVCTDGVHPAVVQSFGAAYAVVPPTSTGHPLNLFLAPVVETPKDESVGRDFSHAKADCGPAPADIDSDAWAGCCSLDYSAMGVLSDNLGYFKDTLTQIGADTPDTNDDIKVLLGVNPTWIRAARTCLALDNDETRKAGFDALAVVGGYTDVFTYANWTHTSMEDLGFSDAADYYIDYLYPPNSWSQPMDGQSEYQMLHDGLAAQHLYDDLGTVTIEGTPHRMTDYEFTFAGGAGNSFDGNTMWTNGWTDGSWVDAIRNGPVATGGAPLDYYYFASAGAIPEIGLNGARKKELFPIDLKDRLAVFEMGEDPETWYEGGSSGMLYLPGMNQALNTVGDIAEGGVFRESLTWGLTIDDDDWTGIRRYARRILASSQPDAVKTWYVHIFDLSSTEGDFRRSADGTDTFDRNIDALQGLNTDLITPGYARWALPEDIVQEYWDGRR